MASVSRASAVPARSPRYRPAAAFPPVVKENCRIYLDEGLFNNALALLADLVTPGASHPQHLILPTYAPEPYHLEIVSTLLVHPKFTTQRTDDHRDADYASRSITLLRDVLAILGPLNAKLGEAFTFEPLGGGRRNRRARQSEDSSASSDDDEERVDGIAANQGRVRANANDFWHVVGWALNCSVAHPKRWKYWKVWLDYMLDVLDADWNERERADSDTAETKITGDKKMAGHTFLLESLLVKYLSGCRGRSSEAKRVVRAVFADGGAEDLRAYPEVFKDETKVLKPKKEKKGNKLGQPPEGGFEKETEGDFMFDCICGVRGKVNDGLHHIGCDKCEVWQHSKCLGISQTKAEQEDFQFICKKCADEDLEGPSSSQETDDSEEKFDPMLGGTEAMVIRKRLIIQLSRVAFMLPDCFVPVRDLYPIYATNIHHLPLPAFSVMMSAADSSHFRWDVYASLLWFLFRRLLPAAAPDPSSASPDADNDAIDQEILQQCLLPFPADNSSTSDNAKVSMLVENAFRLLTKATMADIDSVIFPTPQLYDAVERGIKAREKICKGDRRRKEKSGKKEELNEGVWLDASSHRLRSLYAWIEAQGSRTPP